MRYAIEPGVLRRLWWRTTQRKRVAVTCLSMLLSLAGTSLVLAGGGQAPKPAAVTAFPSITTPRPADPTVTVRTVSAVDTFEGVGTASGELIEVRVAGIRSISPCWQDESLGFARDALHDKTVRLVLSGTGSGPDGRRIARVLLPDGDDFAQSALNAGAALVGTGNVSAELLRTEVDARANRRGLWARACAPTQAGTSTSELPVSTTTTTTTSAAPAPGTATVPTPAPPEQTTTTTTTTTTTSRPADVQQGVQAGRPCRPEGSLGVTDQGKDMTCRRTLTGLRWSAR